MENNKFDHLIPEISRKLTMSFVDSLIEYNEFKGDIDTSPLLNMTIAVFLSSFINTLEKIQILTKGEEKLIKNIELTQSSLIKLFEELPFVKKIEFMEHEL